MVEITSNIRRSSIGNVLKTVIQTNFVFFLIYIFTSCSSELQLPDLLPGETLLGPTGSAHSLTRGHDRKIIYDPNYNHWYIFWQTRDRNKKFDINKEGVVYQKSSDGLNWSSPSIIESYQQGGITGWDVKSSGNSLYLLGHTDTPDSNGSYPSKYAVRKLNIQKDGSLTKEPPAIIFKNDRGGDYSTDHFYGSLLHDSNGYFWVAARVGDSTPGTHVDVIRSTEPNSIAAWGPKGCNGESCNDAWTDPYSKSNQTLHRGTIAPLLLDLGKYGIGLLIFNKNDAAATKNPFGQLLFVRNLNHTHDGWEAKSIILTDRANQFIRQGSAPNADKTRLDDRRFSAVVDPRTNIIHIAYVLADSKTSENANLRYFTLSPPYRLEDKSAEKTVIKKEVDGLNMSIDTRTESTIIYFFYVSNNHPDYQIKMIKKTGTEWSLPVNISNGKGVVRYPQSPVKIFKDQIVIGYQYSTKNPKGRGYLYRICVKKIDI